MRHNRCVQRALTCDIVSKMSPIPFWGVCRSCPRKRDLSDQLLIEKLASSGKRLSWLWVVSQGLPNRPSRRRLIHRKEENCPGYGF
ncbi:hypothetical protein K443DRAFT_192851 [Laccaria amethystina LaAM-08-1]|uniref:Uncharacterized protein n=1 Tax=Laccaria amethystina LaAM-08-1 TaxID=1095629 RepID=A0A0C9XMV6_9AGAR|nr:hypothetical protein K443DRAFT_192851 [Laccaria amethystina LaAM-08-1]